MLRWSSSNLDVRLPCSMLLLRSEFALPPYQRQIDALLCLNSSGGGYSLRRRAGRRCCVGRGRGRRWWDVDQPGVDCGNTDQVRREGVDVGEAEVEPARVDVAVGLIGPLILEREGGAGGRQHADPIV